MADRPVVVIDLSSGTWRWTRDFLESRQRSAMAALRDPVTPANQVDYHRGALAVCQDLIDLAEGIDSQRPYEASRFSPGVDG